MHLTKWLLICLIIKNLNPKVIEFFIRSRKLNVSLGFITDFYFVVPKIVRLYSTLFHYFFITALLFHYSLYFIMKIPNKQEFVEQTALNDFRYILNFKTLWIFIKKCTAKPHYFLLIDATLALVNPLKFQKNISERI